MILSHPCVLIVSLTTVCTHTPFLFACDLFFFSLDDSPSAANVVAQFQDISSQFLKEYYRKTPSRLQIIDAFLVFAVLTGVIQFMYMLFISNFPYNSFLAGFLASVGFFVFTVALRLQISDPKDFGNISAERAFASYIVCNLILFFVVITFLG